MTEDGGATFVDLADLMDTSARPPAASKAEFWTFWKNDFVPFQDLLLVLQAVFTLWHVHNRVLDTNGEAALRVSQGEAAVHRHHRLLSAATTGFKSNTAGAKSEHDKKQSCCDSASGLAERADNGYL